MAGTPAQRLQLQVWCVMLWDFSYKRLSASQLLWLVPWLDVMCLLIGQLTRVRARLDSEWLKQVTDMVAEVKALDH